VIRIFITSAAFEAIAGTLQLGSVDFEPQVDEATVLEPLLTTVLRARLQSREQFLF
jgi:hypothetical protein